MLTTACSPLPFPTGLSFSTKEDIEKAIAYNKGNAAYDQHYWEDVIGPLPDMGKGMPKGESSPLMAAPQGATLKRE